MIRVVNLSTYKKQDNEVLILVNRKTVVGNKFFMHNESERDLVCDKYEQYFNEKVRLKTDKTFMDYLRHIYIIAKTHNVALGCHCFPKRCHAETIKKYIESYL